MLFCSFAFYFDFICQQKFLVFVLLLLELNVKISYVAMWVEFNFIQCLKPIRILLSVPLKIPLSEITAIFEWGIYYSNKFMILDIIDFNLLIYFRLNSKMKLINLNYRPNDIFTRFIPCQIPISNDPVSFQVNYAQIRVIFNCTEIFFSPECLPHIDVIAYDIVPIVKELNRSTS